MATLPVSTDLTGSSITEAQAKTWFTQLRDFLSGLLGTAGTIPTALAALQAPFAQGFQWIPGAYMIPVSDRGKLLGIGSAATITLPAALSAGSGFMIAIRSFANGVVVDGKASEAIDAGASITLNAGESCALVCTGGDWWTFAKSTASYVRATLSAGGNVYQRAQNTRFYGDGSYPTPLSARSNESAIAGAVDSPGSAGNQTGRAFFLIRHAGQVTFSLDLNGNDSSTVYARVLKNGSQVQSWSRGSATPATFTQNIGVAIGDIIEAQCRASATMDTAYISNVRLLVATVPTDDF